jgi:hypothetical protein
MLSVEFMLLEARKVIAVEFMALEVIIPTKFIDGVAIALESELPDEANVTGTKESLAIGSPSS